MTKEEILALPNLQIAEETQNFIHIHAAEGYTITPWNSETQDIREFYESECYYFPKSKSFSGLYKAITRAEADEYHRLQNEALEADRIAEEEARKKEEEAQRLEYQINRV